MNLTTVLAGLGSITGVAGLGWQISTHRLTGRRVQVMAFRERVDELWVIRTHLMNVGRLDVSVQSYSTWADPAGNRLRRLRWRIQAIRELGWSHAWRAQALFPPAAAFSAPGGFADHATRVQFPFVLKAGEMYVFPTLEVHIPPDTDRTLKVSVGLGVGRPAQAKVQNIAALQSRHLDVPEEQGWSMSVNEAWNHPAFAPEEDLIAPGVTGSYSLTHLAAAASRFIDDLSRIRETPRIASLREVAVEMRDQILATQRVSDSHLVNLQLILEQESAVSNMLASGQELKAAIDVVTALR